MPMLQVESIAFCAVSITSSKEVPVEARDFPHQNLARHSTALFPFRLCRRSNVIIGDHGLHLDPIGLHHPPCHLDVHVVPRIVPIKNGHAPLRRLQHESRHERCAHKGEANISPTATTSTMFLPA